MKRLIFSVLDRAAETYGQPFFQPAKGSALRSFTDEVNRKADDNPLYNHPEHFDLYVIGHWDDSTGEITPIRPEMLLMATSAKTN